MSKKLIILNPIHFIVVDDEAEIKHNDIVLANGKTYNNEIYTFSKYACPPPNIMNKEICKKIIYSNYLSELPILNYTVAQIIEMVEDRNIENAINFGLNYVLNMKVEGMGKRFEKDKNRFLQSKLKGQEFEVEIENDKITII